MALASRQCMFRPLAPARRARYPACSDRLPELQSFLFRGFDHWHRAQILSRGAGLDSLCSVYIITGALIEKIILILIKLLRATSETIGMHCSTTTECLHFPMSSHGQRRF